MLLRDYQFLDFKKCKKFLKKGQGKRGVLVACTSYGKSWVIVELCNWIRSRGETVLVLQPNGDLLKQNIDKYNSIAKEKATAFSASVRIKDVNTKNRKISDTVFGTIGTVKSVKDLYKLFDHVIIDECHFCRKRNTNDKLGEYWKVFKKFKGNILGLTATPYHNIYCFDPDNENDQWSELQFITEIEDPFWTEVIDITTAHDLSKKKMYLSKLEYEELPEVGKGKLNSIKSNYDKEWQISYETALLDQIAVRANQLTEEGYSKTIIYMQSLDIAFKLTKLLDKCEIIYSSVADGDKKTKSGKQKMKPMSRAKRVQYLQDLKDGNLRFLVNVGTLTTGVDIPDLDSMIVARNTLSLTLIDQIYGRGSRVHPNKHHCKVITTKQNFKLFGRKKDITFKKIKGRWEILSCGKVISGKPIHLLGNTEKSKVVVPFGKYKGEKLHNVPVSYWTYMFDKTDFSEKPQNKKLVKKIKNYYGI